MEIVKLAIVGSRTFHDYTTFIDILNIIKTKYDISTIISGGAKGADTLAEEYADKFGINKLIFKADWHKYGKAQAGYVRNVDIIVNCDVCLAFWDGESRGTKHDITLCQEFNKKCYIYNFKTNEFIEQQNGIVKWKCTLHNYRMKLQTLKTQLPNL